MFPDPVTRKLVTDEQPRLPLSYYQQRIPAPSGWDDCLITYIEFGPPYDVLADEARERGYAVYRLPGAHLHQIVEPEAVADLLLTAVVPG